MANRVDLRKLFKLKTQGVPTSKALIESGASASVAKGLGNHNKQIKKILQDSTNYFREHIIRGALKVASIETIGQRLMTTAIHPTDNFNSSNAIKILGQIIMTKNSTVGNINIGNVFVIPPQLAQDKWQERYGNSKPTTFYDATAEKETEH